MFLFYCYDNMNFCKRTCRIHLPIGIEIFLQLTGIEHLITEHFALLQGGNILADAVVEFRVVAAGEEVIDFLAELLQLCQHGTQFGGFQAPFGVVGVDGIEAVAEGCLSVGGIDAAHAEQGIATPLVDADIQFYVILPEYTAFMNTSAVIREKRRLG